MSDTAIHVEHLSKKYRLGVINNGTLWRDIQTWIALKRGKEDPHSEIGSDRYSNTENHFWALKDISFEVKEGDRIGIIGKNGAGKSTILKLLSRITAPTEGIIKIKGKVASLLEVGTGFHGELTGRENIYLNGAILGMKKRRITQKMDEIVSFSGIEQYIDTPVKRYSSGMYVRLAFAVAAHLDSDILIADEVLAVGDADFQKKALGKMQDLSTGQGRTVLFVSHNMEAVRNLCNCGIVLEKGRIRESSNNIAELISDYLANFETTKKTMKWINNGEFRDPCFTPLSLEFQEEDGRAISGKISSDRAYRVELVYKIEVAHPAMVFYIGFTAGDINFMSSPVITSDDYQPLPGIYRSYFTVPPKLLNLGNFIIRLYAQLRNIKYIINGKNFDISLSVEVDEFEMPLKWHFISKE